MLIANPIPQAYAMAEEAMAECIDRAIALANEKGIKGKAITPFLLDQIKTLTEGKSLAANIQLVLNNARLGAEIAKALCAITQ